MEYGLYDLNNKIKRDLTNKELEQYYLDQYSKFPFDCLEKRSVWENYKYYMDLNIKEGLNGIIRRGGY